MGKLSLLFCIVFWFGSTNVWAGESSPWDAYKAINEVILDLNDIRRAKGINTLIEATVRDASKTPTDVYQRAYSLLERLEQLSRRRGYAVAESVQLPKRKAGRMIPDDVVALLLKAKRITEKLKKVVKAKKNIVDVRREPGKTPPDVYQKVMKAIALVDTL